MVSERCQLNHHKLKYQSRPLVEEPHLLVYCHFLIYIVKIYSLCLKFFNGFGLAYYVLWASLVAQMVKNLLAMQETQVHSLGQEDPLEKGITTHSIFLPGEFHGQRSLAG